MKISRAITFAFAALLALSPVTSFAKGSKAHEAKATAPAGHHAGHVKVKGYVKKNGTVVAPHHRSAPNRTKADNWSAIGNVNPDTGEVGTKKP